MIRYIPGVKSFGPDQIKYDKSQGEFVFRDFYNGDFKPVEGILCCRELDTEDIKKLEFYNLSRCSTTNMTIESYKYNDRGDIEKMFPKLPIITIPFEQDFTY
jgi:hypothetical protein